MELFGKTIASLLAVIFMSGFNSVASSKAFGHRIKRHTGNVCLRRIQFRAKRQVYDIEVETVPHKPLEEQIPVVDGVLQNPEVQAVGLPDLLYMCLAQPNLGTLLLTLY